MGGELEYLAIVFLFCILEVAMELGHIHVVENWDVILSFPLLQDFFVKLWAIFYVDLSNLSVFCWVPVLQEKNMDIWDACNFDCIFMQANWLTLIC